MYRNYFQDAEIHIKNVSKWEAISFANDQKWDCWCWWEPRLCNWLESNRRLDLSLKGWASGASSSSSSSGSPSSLAAFDIPSTLVTSDLQSKSEWEQVAKRNYATNLGRRKSLSLFQWTLASDHEVSNLFYFLYYIYFSFPAKNPTNKWYLWCNPFKLAYLH